MTYEIQHYTLCDGWINTWSDEHGHPITFKTKAAAHQALEDFFLECKGEDLEPYDREEFRIGRKQKGPQ